MDRTDNTKQEIYNKLAEFSKNNLDTIADFIDFMLHKKQLEEKKVLKLEGLLKNYDIDCADLKVFKQETWSHVEQETGNG